MKNTTKTNTLNTIKKIASGDPITASEKLDLSKALNDAITKNHSGKMEGFQSLSTSVLKNPQCKKNAAIPGSVCAHCYAGKLLKMRNTLNSKLEYNTELLTAAVIPFECLPTIYNLYFRFESFGDLNNAIQVVNYFNICKKNPSVSFALWTKNPHFIAEAMEKYNIEKPENLNIIYSSLFLNSKNESTAKKYSFIDKVFTVYSSDYIKENNININCGGLHCMSCLKCYTKNNITDISEKLK